VLEYVTKQHFSDNASSCEFMSQLQLLVMLTGLQLVRKKFDQLVYLLQRENLFFQASTSTDPVLNHVNVSLVSIFFVDINTKHRRRGRCKIFIFFFAFKMNKYV